jgi:aldose 1-epimerase
MVGAVALAAGDARVVVAPATGGAIAAFSHRGVEVLRPAPEGSRDVRALACWPLVPYSNRIASARLAFAGREHALARNFGDHPHAIHGTGWQRPWSVVASDEASVLLRLEHVPGRDGARAWPWPFRAMQWIAVRADERGAVLTARLSIANAGDVPFPFGLGFHPIFPRTAATVIGFRAAGVWETDDTRIPTVHAAIPETWRFDPPHTPPAATIDNVFTGWDGAATLLDEERGVEVALAADSAASFLVVFAPQARDFVALEPVTHETDAFNRAARGVEGTGTRKLGPGAAFSCTMRIAVRPLP